MTRSLQRPTAPALVPAIISLDQCHRMADVGVWDDRHVDLLNGVVVELLPEGTATKISIWCKLNVYDILRRH